MKTLKQYRDRTEALIGRKVIGISRDAEVPDEGAVITAGSNPSTVRIGFIDGSGSIGLRGLEELAFLPNAEESHAGKEPG
jgi:hypothetical protein